MLKAAAPMGAEEEAMLKALAHKQEAAPTPAAAGPWTTESITGAASAAVERYWASLKSQARAAGEYTTSHARAAGEYTTSKALAAGEYTTLKARAAGEYTTLRTRQGVALFGEPNIGPIKTIVDR